MKCKVCGREYNHYSRYEGVCSYRCEYYYKYIISDDYWSEVHWERFMNDRIFTDFLNGEISYWAVDRLKRFYESFSNAWKDDTPIKVKYVGMEVKDEWGNYKKKRKRADGHRMKTLEGVYEFLNLQNSELEIQKKILTLFAINIWKDEKIANEKVQKLLEGYR